MKFCSHCGSSISRKIPDGDNRERHVCSGCKVIHYNNPRIITGSIPVYRDTDGDKLLLCRRAIEPQLGLWTLPAGFLELGESVSEGAARETTEETGAVVTMGELYCLFNLPHIGQVYMLHRAQLLTPEFAQKTDESLEVALFAEHEIPWQKLAFRTMKRTLFHYFNDCKQGVFPLRIEDIGPPPQDPIYNKPAPR